MRFWGIKNKGTAESLKNPKVILGTEELIIKIERKIMKLVDILSFYSKKRREFPLKMGLLCCQFLEFST